MSRRESNQQGSGFLGKLAWTVVLGLVFGAGLITGQRLIHNQSRPALVSVSSTAGDSNSSADKPEESRSKKEPIFSFYDKLARGDQPDEEGSDDEPEQNSAASPDEKNKETDGPEDRQEAEADEPGGEESGGEESPAEDSGGEKADGTEADDGEKYTLQISAHSALEKARSQVRRLEKMGLDPHVISARIPDKGKYYRVRLGKFSSMEQARHLQTELKRKRGVDTFVSPL